MKGIDNIITRLESEARAEIDALDAKSRVECDRILAGYREQAEAAYASRIRAGKEQCASRAERLASAADLESRKQLLGFKQELVGDIFSKASARLAALPREDYVRFLARQAAKAAEGDAELIFNAKDAKEVGAAVAEAANALRGGKGTLTVSAETRPISGGVIVKQGDIEANCAIETLVGLRRSDLAGQVAEILFA